MKKCFKSLSGHFLYQAVYLSRETIKMTFTDASAPKSQKETRVFLRVTRFNGLKMMITGCVAFVFKLCVKQKAFEMSLKIPVAMLLHRIPKQWFQDIDIRNKMWERIGNLYFRSCRCRTSHCKGQTTNKLKRLSFWYLICIGPNLLSHQSSNWAPLHDAQWSKHAWLHWTLHVAVLAARPPGKLCRHSKTHNASMLSV